MGGIVSALSKYQQRGCKLGGGPAFLCDSFSTCQRHRVLKARGRRGILCRCGGRVPPSPRRQRGPTAPKCTQSRGRARGTPNWTGGRGGNGSPQFCPARVVRRAKPSVRLGNPITRSCSSSSTFFLFPTSMLPLSSSSSFHSASPSKALQMAFQTRKPFKEKWAHIPF